MSQCFSRFESPEVQESGHLKFQFHDLFWVDFMLASTDKNLNAKNDLRRVLKVNAFYENLYSSQKFLERIELCACYAEKLLVNLTKETNKSKKIVWRRYELLEVLKFTHMNSGRVSAQRKRMTQKLATQLLQIFTWSKE